MDRDDETTRVPTPALQCCLDLIAFLRPNLPSRRRKFCGDRCPPGRIFLRRPLHPVAWRGAEGELPNWCGAGERDATADGCMLDPVQEVVTRGDGVSCLGAHTRRGRKIELGWGVSDRRGFGRRWTPARMQVEQTRTIVGITYRERISEHP